MLELAVDVIETVNPDPLAAAAVLALANELAGTDIRTCGPDPQSTALIPQCPIPGVCFTAACSGHDDCYATCGSTQAACDEAFFWDMVYLCQAGVGEASLADCLSIGWIYYQAVHRYGGPYFDQTQEIVCDAEMSVETADRDASLARVAVAPILQSAPFADADDDLLPDDWELEVMLDPQDPADALQDYDHDGRVNLAEYLLGIDPFHAD